MRRYYVISPNVWNDNNFKDLLDEMLEGHFVLMGWGTQDDKGKMFANMQIGDCVIVAQRKKRVWTYSFMGTISSESRTYKKAQCRNVDNFIELRNREMELLNDWSMNGSSLIPAIGEIKKGNNPSIIRELDKLINEKEAEMKMNRYVQLLKNTKNLILTGAPGTGKTYLAKKIAEEIVGKEHSANIYFTQFHQSYDYTDFVEGLRPTKSDEGELGFRFLDGTFKSFCKTALSNLIDSGEKQEINSDTLIINEFQLLCDDILSGDVRTVELKSKGQGNLNCNSTRTTIYVNPANSNNPDDPGKYTISLDKIRRISKKYQTLDVVDNTKSSDFEDLFPGASSYGWAILHELYRRIESKHGTNSPKVERQDFVFIIDEINRGEMSKIFGELFYAIDPTCRVTRDDLKNKDFEAITTQYANMNTEPNLFDSCLADARQYGHFFVPENVYVIGTMNDIDRGVESIDFAFRRRFAWEEVRATETQKEILSSIVPNEEKKITLENLCTVMDALNKEIWESDDHRIEGLSSAYHLGAAYFLKIEAYIEEEKPYEQLWNYNLEPILREYLRGMDNAVDNLKKLKNVYYEVTASL